MKSFPHGALAILLTLLTACQNEIWLSDPDGQVERDAGRDASVVPRDANEIDGGETDGGQIEDSDVDAAPHVGRDCELTPVPIVTVGDTGPLETPTFAVSGRLTTLRYGVLVPPAASLTATDDTQLVVLDEEGALLADRRIRLEDASGAVTSAATLHSLSSLSDEEGFLLLTPRAIWMLDADGVGSETTVLTTAPSTVWQRAAGWVDADRFVFVSDTPDLRLAVFDRRTSEVTTTSISATNAAAVHLEPGGATIASAGPTNEIVVYDPDLSGAEVLRTTWSDEGLLLGERLLGAGLSAGERTWVLRNPGEFRTTVTSYRVSPTDVPVSGAMMARLGPLAATLEGPFVAIISADPSVMLYTFETSTFRVVSTDLVGNPIVEHERDGASVAILSFEPAETGRSLELTCGRQ